MLPELTHVTCALGDWAGIDPDDCILRKDTALRTVPVNWTQILRHQLRRADGQLMREEKFRGHEPVEKSQISEKVREQVGPLLQLQQQEDLSPRCTIQSDRGSYPTFRHDPLLQVIDRAAKLQEL